MRRRTTGNGCHPPGPPLLVHNSILSAMISETISSETISEMRILLILLAATAVAQSKPQTHPSNTTESLRGASAVSRDIAWASGTHGTYLRTTDAGRTWLPAQVPDATTSRLPRRSSLLRRRSFPHVRRSRRPVPHLPHHRRRQNLAAPIHQHQSQRLLRLHGFLGQQSRHSPR